MIIKRNDTPAAYAVGDFFSTHISSPKREAVSKKNKRNKFAVFLKDFLWFGPYSSRSVS